MRCLLLLLCTLTACAIPRDQVVLLDAHGALAVATPRQTQTLTQPYQTATVRTSGQVEPGTTTPAAVHQRYGAVLATLPQGGRVYTLYYAPGTAQVTPESQDVVGAILADLASCGACEVEIAGHTDTTGDLAANDRLSLQRAEAIRTLLVEAGMAATFVRVVGRGARALAVPTPTATAEPANRRVEVTVR
jgi:outer membrane protein OmpA-like peptidoglycan-associated protein